jgi:hypothetical protein
MAYDSSSQKIACDVSSGMYIYDIVSDSWTDAGKHGTYGIVHDVPCSRTAIFGDSVYTISADLYRVVRYDISTGTWSSVFNPGSSLLITDLVAGPSYLYIATANTASIAGVYRFDGTALNGAATAPFTKTTPAKYTSGLISGFENSVMAFPKNNDSGTDVAKTAPYTLTSWTNTSQVIQPVDHYFYGSALRCVNNVAYFTISDISPVLNTVYKYDSVNGLVSLGHPFLAGDPDHLVFNTAMLSDGLYGFIATKADRYIYKHIEGTTWLPVLQLTGISSSFCKFAIVYNDSIIMMSSDGLIQIKPVV